MLLTQVTSAFYGRADDGKATGTKCAGDFLTTQTRTATVSPPLSGSQTRTATVSPPLSGSSIGGHHDGPAGNNNSSPDIGTCHLANVSLCYGSVTKRPDYDTFEPAAMALCTEKWPMFEERSGKRQHRYIPHGRKAEQGGFGPSRNPCRPANDEPWTAALHKGPRMPSTRAQLKAT